MSDLPPMGPALELGEYIHSKSGKRYFLIFEGRDSETTEPEVIYQAMYDCGPEENGIWNRPKKMWTEPVEVNGELVPRFQKVPYESSRPFEWLSRLFVKAFGGLGEGPRSF